MTKSPVFYRIVSKVVSHSDTRNMRTIDYHHPGICTATAILLKERNKNMTGIQTVISQILFASNVRKQVQLIDMYAH